jgi:Tfp pilus assembly protein PilW
MIIRRTPAPARPRLAAFTITEMLVTCAIFVTLVAGVISCHLLGLRMFELTKAKVGASDDAREAISLLIGEVRNAKLLRIGNGSLTAFTECGVNSNQVGNAIQIYPTTATNQFVRYWWEAGDKTLRRTTNGVAASKVIANSVSNNLVFTAEDFNGTVHTNNFNNRVIGLTLQFYQLQYPLTQIGPGNFYDFYQLRTKITRRTLE